MSMIGTFSFPFCIGMESDRLSIKSRIHWGEQRNMGNVAIGLLRSTSTNWVYVFSPDSLIRSGVDTVDSSWKLWKEIMRVVVPMLIIRMDLALFMRQETEGSRAYSICSRFINT
jgi:hypothetical protein